MSDQTFSLSMLTLVSFRNWLRVISQNDGIELKYAKKAAIIFTGSLLTGPIRWYERVRYNGTIAATEIKHSPLFILGHWRSGTTFLHDLITRDPRFGYVSTFQALAPTICMSTRGSLGAFLNSKVGRMKRPMDNMYLTVDGPQEDEPAIANVTPYTCYHLWSFPKDTRRYIDHYATFKDIPQHEVEEWKRAYLHLLKKTTLMMDGKQLVLKNPVNMARIPQLLELFPDAKFLHIYRSPYTLYNSMLHLYKIALNASQLQTISEEQLEADMFYLFQAVVGKYFAEKSLIPPQNLIELRYEDVEKDGLAEMRKAYECLGLPDFSVAEPAMRAHIESQAAYQKNRYNFAPELMDKIEKHWGFAIKEWGYERPV